MLVSVSYHWSRGKYKMIKLKSLLKEIERQRSAVWRTPGPGGAPVDVINAVHKIVAIALRSKGKNIKVDDYVRLHDLSGGHWMIENRKHKDIMLSYNGNNSTWYLYGPHSIELGGLIHGGKLTTTQVNHIIKHWI